MSKNNTYIRDPMSGGILNTDHDGLIAYKKQRSYLQNHNNSVSKLTEEVDTIKEELSSIKDLLVKILDK